MITQEAVEGLENKSRAVGLPADGGLQGLRGSDVSQNLSGQQARRVPGPCQNCSC